ncbi:hypothetical protein L6R52_29385, partial [Myxococcota bacterium]|nr:hypothetical protein [Myxococcota bacterium]
EPAPAPRSGMRAGIAGVALAAIAAVAFVVASRFDGSSSVEERAIVEPAPLEHAAGGVIEKPIEAAVQGVAADAGVTPAQPPTVTLTVRASEPGAEIVGPGGVVLGRSPATLELPRSTEKLVLEVRAAGFVTATREIVPLADGEVSITLEPKARVKVLPSKKSKKAGADDLESFE